MPRALTHLDYASPSTPQGVPGIASLRLILLAALVVVAATVAVFGGVNSIDILAIAATDGLIPIIDVIAATLAGMAIVRRIVPGVGRSLLIASGAGTGIGLLITIGLLLGLAGLLNAGTAWALVGMMAVAGADLYLDRPRWRRRIAVSPAAWLWLIPAIGLGVALAAACLPPGILWGDEPHGYDVLSYHLQIPREWHEAGRIMPLEHNVFSYFPLGQETLSLVLMHQMGGAHEAMFASQLLSLLLMGVATLAVYGAVRATASPARKAVSGSRADRVQSTVSPAGEAVAPGTAAEAVEPGRAGEAVGAVVAGVIFAGLPWTVMLGSVAYNEALLMLASALAAAWLLRAVEGDWRSGLMAGLFVGLGVAGKYPAAPMLGVAGGLALVVFLFLRRAATASPLPGATASPEGEAVSGSSREQPQSTASPAGEAVAPDTAGKAVAPRVALTLLAFAAGAMVFALPWLVRNLAWAGNPVFPLGTGLFGDGGWDPVLVERWNTAHTLAAGESRLGRLASDIILNPRFAWLLWPTFLAAAAVAVVRRDGRGVMLATWIALMLLIWLCFTHLQARFIAPALAPAAIVIGLAVTPRWRMAGLVSAGIIAAAGLVYLLPTAFERTRAARSEEVRLYGFDDLTLLTALADMPDIGGRPVYLVGDAKALLYDVDELHYRVVFNVAPGEGAIAAWLGDALENAPDEALVVIDPYEVKRLSESYGTPPLELGVQEPVVVTMRQLRAALGR